MNDIYKTPSREQIMKYVTGETDDCPFTQQFMTLPNVICASVAYDRVVLDLKIDGIVSHLFYRELDGDNLLKFNRAADYARNRKRLDLAPRPVTIHFVEYEK